jgi:hypothetical protein
MALYLGDEKKDDYDFRPRRGNISWAIPIGIGAECSAPSSNTKTNTIRPFIKTKSEPTRRIAIPPVTPSNPLFSLTYSE